MDINKYIDFESGLKRVAGNKMLFGRLLGMFLKSKEFDAFEEALAIGDNKQAGDVAHAIKGIAGNLSLNPLFEISEKLMHDLRDDICDADTIASYRITLQETIEAVTLAIAQM